MMHYLIYKITNHLDNKIYVGKHKTENRDDDYFGSGLLLGRAIEKHGKENFVKELLFECQTEEEMNQREANVVDEDFISRDDTYNIKLGGQGGFDYINDVGKNLRDHDTYSRMSKKGILPLKELIQNDPEFRREFVAKCSNRLSLRQAVCGNLFQGKSHSDETKEKMRKAKLGKVYGSKNPAFGKHWITDGTESKMVAKTVIPVGWRKGRV